MKVGALIRVKEVPGTKLASKRKPKWALITIVGTDVAVEDADYQTVKVEWLPPANYRIYLIRRNFDFPTDRQVPDWVWAEIAKKRLSE